MALLLGLMVVSAQFRLGGFYGAVVERLGASDHSPAGLLGLVVLTADGLSALLANDIVCLAMAPVLVALCARRGLDPLLFLLGLAAAANVGSAATLIGNPQNMLIGELLDLSFAGYLWDAGVPAALGLGVVWAIVAGAYRHRWRRSVALSGIDAPRLNRWQTLKGIAVVTAVVLAFLFTAWPREVVALAAAGVLLISTEMASREMLGLAVAPGRDRHAGRPHPGARVDNGRQPPHRRQHRQHHRRGSGAAAGRGHPWRTHARVGVAVTVATLTLAAAWLWLIG